VLDIVEYGAGDVGESGFGGAKIYSVYAAQNAAVGGDSQPTRLTYRIEVDGGVSLEQWAMWWRAGRKFWWRATRVGHGDPRKNAERC